MKTNILDFFYDKVDEFDWQEGQDLHSSGKVYDIQNYNSLITAKVKSSVSRNNEVRFKIHPSGRCIQWLECTCRKNRTQSLICEHLCAFIITIEKDHPKFFANIDSNMPVQSPIKTKAKKSKALTTSSISKAIENISSVGELKKEKIVNIRQIGKSPTIKVRYESRPGKFEYETLYIDNAAEFFKNNYNHSKATAEVKKLRTFNQEAYFATYIFPDGDDLIAERVVAIKHTKSSLTRLESLAEDADIKNARLIVNRGQKGRLASYELIPIKNMNRQTGDKFIFIPERGYYPINKEDTKKAWEELPFKSLTKVILLLYSYQTNIWTI